MRLPSITHSVKPSSLRLAFTTLVSVLGLSLPPISQIAFKNPSFSPFVLAQTPQQLETQADQLLDQALEQYNRSQFQAAIASWQQALNLYREIGSHAGEGIVLMNLGAAYLSLEEYTTAIDYLQQSLAIAKEIGDREGEGNALMNLGVAYRNLGEYATTIDYYQQSLSIAREIGDRDTEGKALNNLGNAYRNLGEYGSAIDYLQQSLAIAKEIGDRDGEGSALINLGLAYSGLGEYATTIDYSQQALAIAREIGDRDGEGKALNNLGIAYFSLGEYGTAIDFHQQALAIATEIGARALGGNTLMNLGNAYSDLGEYATAIDYYQQSLAIAKEIGAHATERMALNNLGIAYLSLGEYRTAIDYYQQALAIAKEIGDRATEGIVLGNLGIAYENLGEYATAIDYYQQSLAIATKIGARALEGNALINLGNAYSDLGEYATAIDYYQQSLAIAKEIGDRDTEGLALMNLGNAYRNLGEYGTAIDYHQQALAIATEIGDRATEGKVLGNLGNAYLSLGEYTTAINYFQQSLAIAKEIGDRGSEGNALGNLGIAYKNLEEYATAIDYHQQSLAIARTLGDRATEGMALNNLGAAFLNTGQLKEAEIVLRQGIEVRENIREQLDENDAWKVSIFEQQAKTYRLLQWVLIAQNRPEEALEISERGRARAFVELMVQRLATDSEIAAKVEFPNLEQIKQVAQQQNATLVEYSLIFDQFLYIWVIQPTGEIAFRSVDLTESDIPLAEVAERGRITASTSRIRGLDEIDENDTLFTEMVRGTRDSIGNGTAAAQTTTPQPRINRNLQQLHQLLIEPIADLLPTDPNQTVIFIPQGSLFLVPFAALQDETGNFLIEKHTILTAPAIQVLELTQQQPTNETGEVLIVGNPTMPKVSIAVNQPPLQLDPLPGTELEANAIASLLNSDFLSGDRATETAIKQKMPLAKLIHLATHGLLEETDNGMLAAIALTPSNSDDGLLTPDEILGLDLNADLVVLSACDTGIGKITGDGVVGLSRSILTAGARSAVVSLWKVPDAQTAVLMGEFYRQWQETGNKAQALRQAMLTTMQQYPHPMNWAAFTIMGESD